MRATLRLVSCVALFALATSAAWGQDGGSDKPAEIPITEKIARNHEARQKGEPLPYPEAEKGRDAGKPEVQPGAPEGGAPQPANQPGQEQPAGDRTRIAFVVGQGDEEWGTIVVELDDQRVPQTVANFLKYVDSGFYSNTIFHRIKPRYIVQGGGVIADFVEKTEGVLPPIVNEAPRGDKNRKGTIAVARSRNDPNSGTSQFYFNLVDNPRLDHGTDNPGYCVFGRIVEGMEVLDRVATTRVRRSTIVTNEISMPLSPPMLKSVRRLAPGEVVTQPTKPAAAAPATPKPGPTPASPAPQPPPQDNPETPVEEPQQPEEIPPEKRENP